MNFWPTFWVFNEVLLIDHFHALDIISPFRLSRPVCYHRLNFICWCLDFPRNCDLLIFRQASPINPSAYKEKKDDASCSQSLHISKDALPPWLLLQFAHGFLLGSLIRREWIRNIEDDFRVPPCRNRIPICNRF